MSGLRIVVVVLVALLVPASSFAETRRFAIVVGNNAGADALPPLRFAETDAEKMARVFVELGDVKPEDLYLLTARGPGEVETAVRQVRAKIDALHRQPDTRAVVLFYFSGHSDGEALELGRERLGYSTLKALLAGTGAELKVAIVDACRSGSALMQKGGRPAPGFTIRLADQLTARGEVFITSSAQDESSLESSEVSGSYFTHNLVSGLRGAADTSGDRQVTLSEAYHYAYERTVSATAIAPSGAQHPAYDYQLQGSGDLVLASLIRGSSTLGLPEGAERVVVTDLVRDQVVAEVTPGAAREIALEPGDYGVRLLRAGQTYGGRFRIAKGTRYALRWADLHEVVLPTVAAKGPGEVTRVESRRAEGPILGFSVGGEAAATPNVGLQGVLRISWEPAQTTGVEFAVLAGGGSALTSAISETSLGARFGYRAALRTERVFFSIGAEAGLSALWVSGTGAQQTQLGLVAGPRAAFRVRVGGPAWLGVEGEVPLTLVGEEAGVRATMTPSVVLGVALEL